MVSWKEKLKEPLQVVDAAQFDFLKRGVVVNHVVAVDLVSWQGNTGLSDPA